MWSMRDQMTGDRLRQRDSRWEQTEARLDRVAGDWRYCGGVVNCLRWSGSDRGKGQSEA